jgi:hypothetical protein
MFLRIQHKTIPSRADNARTIFKGGIYAAWSEATTEDSKRRYLINDFLYGDNHPQIEGDKVLYRKAKHAGALNEHDWVRGYAFGFASKQQLSNWFHSDSFLVDAHDLGFEVVYFDGEIIKGEKQAIIKIETAKMIKSENLINFTCFPSPI